MATAFENIFMKFGDERAEEMAGGLRGLRVGGVFILCSLYVFFSG